MARARNIKPGFFTNDELAQCEYGARLLFVGLWTIADREGRLEDRPLRIKALLFPFDNAKVDHWLSQLAEHRFITRYESSGCKYISVNNFGKHQHPHIKEPASTIPAPDKNSSGPADCGLPITDTGLPITENGSPAKARTRRAFTPPTVDEVRAYCLERQNGIDAKVFVDFYETNGWVQGKGRKPIKSWKACVRTWENDPGRKPSASRVPTDDDNANWNPVDAGLGLRGAP